MNYDISKHTAPKMPTLGNGTECIRLLLSQASKDMYEPLVPMFFPVLGAYFSGADFSIRTLFGGKTVPNDAPDCRFGHRKGAIFAPCFRVMGSS
jgi:hypothetical protein